jgi:hypothetical protein
MCKKRRQVLRLEVPIFSLLWYKGRLIVSGGGGGDRYGVKNKLVLPWRNSKLKDE